MAATRTGCWAKGCNGIPMAVNDAVSRLSEGYFGRINYVCDKCGTRWSVTPELILKDMGQIKRQKHTSRGKTFEKVWNCPPKVDSSRTWRIRG